MHQDTWIISLHRQKYNLPGACQSQRLLCSNRSEVDRLPVRILLSVKRENIADDIWSNGGCCARAKDIEEGGEGCAANDFRRGSSGRLGEEEDNAL
jgi:hypothetical protein